MKHRILLLFIALLVLTVFVASGCTSEQQNQPSLCWNLDKGTERVPQADGSYQVNFMLDGQCVTYRVADPETMRAIDLHKALGLKVDKNNTVTQVCSLMEMPEYYVALEYYVQSVSAKNVKLNSQPSYNGASVVVDFDESTPVFDVSNFAKNKGSATNLQKGDGVTVVANADGTVNTIYVDSRQGIVVTETRYCPVCEKDAVFTNWFSNACMPAVSGHYYLERDIQIGMGTNLTSGEVTLDLNGKTVTMITDGRRVYTMGKEAILNLVDTVGEGRIVVANGGTPCNNGMFVRMDGFGCQFNMYSGILDASACVAGYGCLVDNYNGVLNVYGGTMLGGTTTGVGGGAIIVQNEVNIYGGEIIGGYCSELSGYKDNPPGGGCIRHNGSDKILNIYGGIIRDGKTDYYGGCIYANGITNLYGGTISGGNAVEAGGGIYVGITGSLNIGGNPVVTDNENGNLYISAGRIVTISENGLTDAKLSIDMAAPGVFVTSPVPKDQVGCFISDSGKIVRNANGSLSLK